MFWNRGTDALSGLSMAQLCPEPRSAAGWTTPTFHLVPVHFNIVQSAVHYLPAATLWSPADWANCRRAYDASLDYLYVEQPHGVGQIAVGTGFGSQVLRRAIAAALGRPDEFDWRSHPQSHTIAKTLKTLDRGGLQILGPNCMSENSRRTVAGFGPADPTDNRQPLDWVSKYPDVARHNIYGEAAYLGLVLLSLPPLMLLLWLRKPQLWWGLQANDYDVVLKYGLAWLAGNPRRSSVRFEVAVSLRRSTELAHGPPSLAGIYTAHLWRFGILYRRAH